jgi:hypothetical protein
MDNIWSWESEDERRKREQATPLQGVQYKTGEQAPSPQQAPAQRTNPLTQYATNKAIGTADRKLMEGGESVWKDLKLNSQIVNEAGLDATLTPPIAPSSVVEAVGPLSANAVAPVTETIVAETVAPAVVEAATSAIAPAVVETAVASAAPVAIAETAALGSVAAAEAPMLAAMGPVGWGIGAVLLAQQLGLFG